MPPRIYQEHYGPALQEVLYVAATKSPSLFYNTGAAKWHRVPVGRRELALYETTEEGKKNIKYLV